MPLSSEQRQALEGWMRSTAIFQCPACTETQWQFAQAGGLCPGGVTPGIGDPPKGEPSKGVPTKEGPPKGGLPGEESPGDGKELLKAGGDLPLPQRSEAGDVPADGVGFSLWQVSGMILSGGVFVFAVYRLFLGPQ